MKKLLLLTLMFCVNQIVQAQIPNADFENWSNNSLSRLSPDDWGCSNDSWNTASVVQDAGYTGTYSAKFLSVFTGSTIASGGGISLYYYPLTGTDRPISLNGYWKTNNPTIHDGFAIHVYLHDAANTNVGTGTLYSPVMSSIGNWTLFTIPITYTNANALTNYTLTIDWNPGTSATTGYGHIDGLFFEMPVGIDGPSNDLNSTRIFQSESNLYQLSFSTKFSSDVKIQLQDITGKIVKTVYSANLNAGTHNFQVETRELSRGVYFCRIETGKDMQTLKLIVN